MPHKVHLQREIEHLKKRLLVMSGLVEDAMHKALRALRTRDADLARIVIQTDEDVDALEVEIEEDCLKILALYQPVAQDLRFVVACLKINNDLERIADQAVNIAERAEYLAGVIPVEFPSELLKLSEIVPKMLKNCLDAFVQTSELDAQEVREQDSEVDQLYRDMYQRTREAIFADPSRCEIQLSVLSVSRQLERIADQVTNIAEDIIYLIRGSIVRHMH